MISYEPFWEQMKEKEISTYMLEYEYGINKAIIHRLKHDHNFNIGYLDYLCAVFHCNIQDIVICMHEHSV